MQPFLKAICCLILLTGQALAEVINYQGRLSVNGVPVNGISRFKFALVGEQGAAVWSSQEIILQVNHGVYAVRLGDSAQAPTISEALLHQGTPVKLRIWFDRNEKGWARVGDDILVSRENAAPPIAGGGEGSAMLAELREIHALLAGQNKGEHPPEAPQIVTVSIVGAPSLGKAGAPLVLVEFTDFQCPFCIKFQNEVFARLKTNYVDTGKLRIVSHNLPLAFHSFAGPAARAAICADAQGLFWPMREKLFAAGKSLSDEAINQVARDVGLDAAKFAACVTNKDTADVLLRDGQEAKTAAIEATPTFVLGRDVAGKVTGLKIIGAQPYAAFASEIDKMLAAGGGQ
jgi:protein-disulfide isomerase